MSTVSSCSIINPYGKTDECSQLVIDDLTKVLTFNGVMVVGQEYTFGAWIKSETAEGSILVGGSTFSTSTEWEQYTVTFEAESTDFYISFGTTDTYYIYHSQLEIGTLATDWTPAPEDVDQNIADSEDRVLESLGEKETSILQTSEEIILSALETYVQTSDYEQFRSSVETQLSIMSDEILMSFTSTNEQIDEVDADMQTKFAEMAKHISFSENGITISSGENQMSINIDNDLMIFEKNGVQFGWWDGIDFHTGNIMVDVTERAQFGNFAYVPRTDGSLSFLKVEHKAGFYAVLRSGILFIYGAYPTLEDNTLVINDIPATLEGTTLMLTEG